MDRSWMYTNRTREEYKCGLVEFCKVAVENKIKNSLQSIVCPCHNCGSGFSFPSIKIVKDHLTIHGFKEDYTTWIWHGETTNLGASGSGSQCHLVSLGNVGRASLPTSVPNENDIAINLEEDDIGIDHDVDSLMHDVEDHCSKRPDLYQKMKDAAKTPLFPGAKHNKLSASLKLFAVKAKSGWTDKSFTALLEELKDILPMENKIPISTYEAKKIMCPMGMDYKKIHACPNDCILYWKQFEHLDRCPFCKFSRYQSKDQSPNETEVHSPAKVLWYLPIIPRLKRLFASKKDARYLRFKDYLLSKLIGAKDKKFLLMPYIQRLLVFDSNRGNSRNKIEIKNDIDLCYDKFIHESKKSKATYLLRYVNCAKQPEDTQSGFYVMNYMYEIVTKHHDATKLLQAFKSSLPYEDKDLKIVFDELVDYLGNNATDV